MFLGTAGPSLGTGEVEDAQRDREKQVDPLLEEKSESG